MGKYGSGTSMKTVITMELEEVTRILDRNHVPENDKKQILDAFKEMAYQWCESNATACALQKLMEVEYQDVYKEIMGSFLRSKVYHEEYAKKMQDTLPDWEEDE